MSRKKLRRPLFFFFLHSLPDFCRFAGIVARFRHQNQPDLVGFRVIGAAEPQRHAILLNEPSVHQSSNRDYRLPSGVASSLFTNPGGLPCRDLTSSHSPRTSTTFIFVPAPIRATIGESSLGS